MGERAQIAGHLERCASCRSDYERTQLVNDWLIADKGYDSDPLRQRLARKGIELICPYRCNNKEQKYYNGRKMRRYQRRYKVERTFSWLGNFRRLVVRWDRDMSVYNAFFHIACLILTLRRL